MQNINTKWLWVLGGLLLLNLGLLGYLVFGGKKKPKQRPQRALLESTLGFTATQNEKFENLRSEHRKIATEINKEIEKLKVNLFSDYTSPEADAEANSLMQKIGELHVKLDLATRNHFRDVRNLCSAEQKEIFDNSINKLLQGGPPRRMEGERPQRPDGPPPMGRPNGEREGPDGDGPHGDGRHGDGPRGDDPDGNRPPPPNH